MTEPLGIVELTDETSMLLLIAFMYEPSLNQFFSPWYCVSTYTGIHFESRCCHIYIERGRERLQSVSAAKNKRSFGKRIIKQRSLRGRVITRQLKLRASKSWTGCLFATVVENVS